MFVGDILVSHDIASPGRDHQPRARPVLHRHQSPAAAASPVQHHNQHHDQQLQTPSQVFLPNPHPSNNQPSVHNIQRLYRDIERSPVVWSTNLAHSEKLNVNDLCLQDVSSEGL